VKNSISLETWSDFLGNAGSASYASYIHPISPDKMEKLNRRKERFSKNKSRSVNTRRSFNRNKAIILSIGAAVIGLALIIGSVIRDRANQPSTRGMEPLEVVETYYHSMGELDHVFMQAAVLNKTGKDDIDMTMNLFVLSKIRQTYEMANPSPIISAEKWIEDGSPLIDSIVFGISALEIQDRDRDASDGQVSFSASYTLWLPIPGNIENGEDVTAPRLPEGQIRFDTLRLVLHKGAWRIAEIERK
jgi:hypothetical protein